MDLVQKIKTALRHLGKLHLNSEEATNVKGQIHDGVLEQIWKQMLCMKGNVAL